MAFSLQHCAIPTVWCGNGRRPSQKAGDTTYYTKTGTRHDCLKKGFGAGKYTEIGKRISQTSLQQIKYVNRKYEKRFQRKGINNLTELVERCKNLDPQEIRLLLRKMYKNEDDRVDKKPYNATLIYLYQHGNDNLPTCKKI